MLSPLTQGTESSPLWEWTLGLSLLTDVSAASEPSEFAPSANILPSPRLMGLSPHLVGARAHSLLPPSHDLGEVSTVLRAIHKPGRAQTLPTGKVKTPQQDTE